MGRILHGPSNDGPLPHSSDDDGQVLHCHKTATGRSRTAPMTTGRYRTAPATAQAKQRAKEERRAEDGKRKEALGSGRWAEDDGGCGVRRQAEEMKQFPIRSGFDSCSHQSRTKHGKIWRASRGTSIFSTGVDPTPEPFPDLYFWRGKIRFSIYFVNHFLM